MALKTLIVALLLVAASEHASVIEVPSPAFSMEAPGGDVLQESQEDPWSEVTIIKTHYDCHGLPMWREVSKMKARVGEPAELVKTSREAIARKKETSASETPVFFKSMKSRFRTASPRPTTSSTTSSTTAPGHPPPAPLGPDVVEVGPDRVIDTPIVSCPEGFNEDYNGRCRPVFPEQL